MNADWIKIFEILIGIVIALMFLWVQQKVKNVATIQDIRAITKEVESVKQELSVLTNKHNILFEEEKEAIALYLSAWNVWYSNLKLTLPDYHFENYNELEKLPKKYNNEFDNAQVAFSKLELFVINDELIQAAKKLNKVTYELQKYDVKYIWQIFGIYLKNENDEANELRRKGSIHAARILEARQEIFKNNMEEVDKFTKEYEDNLKPYFDNIGEARKAFIQIGKDYIRKDVK